MTGESAALSAVIGGIYDAAIDPALWPKALEDTCEYIGGFQAVMFWQDTTAEEVNTLYSYNDDPHYSALYYQTYAPLNPVFPAAIFRDVGSVNAASDLVPRDEMRETRFYKEWIAPQGMTDSIGVLLERDVARAAFLTIQWREETIGDVPRQRMAALVPHFQRAVAIGRLFAKHQAAESAFAETLDHFDAGVFLVASDGRITFANAPGQKLLDARVLLRSEGETLRAVDPDADRLLRDSLREVEGEIRSRTAKGIEVPLSGTAEHRWTANVLPLGDGRRRKVGTSYKAAAAVFVRDSTFADPTPIEALARDYDLTASEIRVVEVMLRVSGLDAMATALGVSRATVKTHLNHIFRKTSARNQGDLIKLISGIGKRD